MNFGLGGKKHGRGVFSGQILFLGILLLLLRKTNSQQEKDGGPQEEQDL
jgi:hypothetical protein